MKVPCGIISSCLVAILPLVASSVPVDGSLSDDHLDLPITTNVNSIGELAQRNLECLIGLNEDYEHEQYSELVESIHASLPNSNDNNNDAKAQECNIHILSTVTSYLKCLYEKSSAACQHDQQVGKVRSSFKLKMTEMLSSTIKDEECIKEHDSFMAHAQRGHQLLIKLNGGDFGDPSVVEILHVLEDWKLWSSFNHSSIIESPNKLPLKIKQCEAITLLLNHLSLSPKVTNLFLSRLEQLLNLYDELDIQLDVITRQLTCFVDAKRALALEEQTKIGQSKDAVLLDLKAKEDCLGSLSDKKASVRCKMIAQLQSLDNFQKEIEGNDVLLNQLAKDDGPLLKKRINDLGVLISEHIKESEEFYKGLACRGYGQVKKRAEARDKVLSSEAVQSIETNNAKCEVLFPDIWELMGEFAEMLKIDSLAGDQVKMVKLLKDRTSSNFLAMKNYSVALRSTSEMRELHMKVSLETIRDTWSSIVDLCGSRFSRQHSFSRCLIGFPHERIESIHNQIEFAKQTLLQSNQSDVQALRKIAEEMRFLKMDEAYKSAKCASEDLIQSLACLDTSINSFRSSFIRLSEGVIKTFTCSDHQSLVKNALEQISIKVKELESYLGLRRDSLIQLQACDQDFLNFYVRCFDDYLMSNIYGLFVKSNENFEKMIKREEEYQDSFLLEQKNKKTLLLETNKNAEMTIKQGQEKMRLLNEKKVTVKRARGVVQKDIEQLNNCARELDAKCEQSCKDCNEAIAEAVTVKDDESKKLTDAFKAALETRGKGLERQANALLQKIVKMKASCGNSVSDDQQVNSNVEDQNLVVATDINDCITSPN